MASGAIVDFQLYGLNFKDTSTESLATLGKHIIEVFTEDYNFCYLKNHAVKMTDVEELMEVSQMVFELPAAVKSKFPMNTADKVGCVLLETEKLDIERSAGDLHEEFKII